MFEINKLTLNIPNTKVPLYPGLAHLNQNLKLITNPISGLVYF